MYIFLIKKVIVFIEILENKRNDQEANKNYL